MPFISATFALRDIRPAVGVVRSSDSTWGLQRGLPYQQAVPEDVISYPIDYLRIINLLKSPSLLTNPLANTTWGTRACFLGARNFTL